MNARRALILALLFAINAVNFFDRQILAAVTEPLRREWDLSDTQIGWLGTAFALLYAVVGIPAGRLADLWKRKWLMAAGLSLWSFLTVVSGMCRSFGSLFAARLGIGIGEAACAPAATSWIGDLFGTFERARAMSIFMLGLPVGLALSYIVSGTIAHHYGWRYAFLVAGIPGLMLTLLLLPVREPLRGAAESVEIGAARRPGSPYLIVLSLPTMWVIIVSGALHNFNLYGISSFLPAYLTRYHGATLQQAGFLSGLVIGGMGAAGMLLGGWLGDAAMRRRSNGRMLVAAASLLMSAPVVFSSLEQSSIKSFIALLGLAYMLMYFYYANIYATIHDILEPALRGTGMAIYFFAMYLMGAALGPVGTGWLSDFMARRAANLPPAAAIPEQFRAVGLHQAMYVIPVIALMLTAVLFLGSLTVRSDINRLRTWMARAHGSEPKSPGPETGTRRTPIASPL